MRKKKYDGAHLKIRFNKKQLALVDEFAKELDLSRSETIRGLIGYGLATLKGMYEDLKEEEDPGQLQDEFNAKMMIFYSET